MIRMLPVHYGYKGIDPVNPFLLVAGSYRPFAIDAESTSLSCHARWRCRQTRGRGEDVIEPFWGIRARERVRTMRWELGAAKSSLPSHARSR